MASQEQILLQVCIKDDNYSCNICEKFGADKSEIIEHIRTEHKELVTEKYFERNRESLFTCKICDEEYPTRDEIIDHVLTDHDDDEISSNCDECDQVFATTYDMIIHRRQDHKGESNNICGFASEHGKHRHK